LSKNDEKNSNDNSTVHNNDEVFSYSKSGVDLNKHKNAHQIIGEIISRTYKFRNNKFGQVIGEYGHYAGLIDIGSDRCLALHVDGVGTKVLVAQMLNKYDTIGIDLIAMHANDLICMGAEPVALEDYLAVETIDNSIIQQIMLGIAKGAEIAQMAIIGGETAIMPDIIRGIAPGKGIDLSGMSIGIVDKGKIITGESIEVGDSIIGIKSSGIHSNGLTLARKAFFELAKMTPYDKLNGSDETIGSELLKPTLIYSTAVLEIIQSVQNEIHGLAHITGGAFTKLNRLRPKHKSFGFNLDNLPNPPTIFNNIQKIANLPYSEMYKTFNMGIGFCIFSPQNNIDSIIRICKKHNLDALQIGTVINKPIIKIIAPNKEEILL